MERFFTFVCSNGRKTEQAQDDSACINTIFNTVFKGVKSHTGKSQYFGKKTDDNSQFPGVEQMQVNGTFSNKHLKAY